jgi:simple sugar transport system permease protein
MVVKLKFNAFILTLAMLILLAGIQQGIVSGQSVYNMPASFTYLGSAYWWGFPVSAWTTLAVFLVAGLYLRYHRTGRASTRSAGTPRPLGRRGSSSTASASACSAPRGCSPRWAD